MKIGIIGSGHIGGTLARLWVQAGHEVILSSRHPENLTTLAEYFGPKASTATSEEAAKMGDVVLLSIPLGEIPKLSPDIRKSLIGKVVMDTTNPYPDRDGRAGYDALHHPEGSGVWVSQFLPKVKIVKAFNTVYYKLLDTEAHRHKESPLGVPLASDDSHAMQIVAKLVEDAGFGPVMTGKLSKAKEFDNGTPPYASGASVNELKKMLKL